MPEVKLTFFKDFNNIILTVDGLIITIVGSLLFESKNLLIINGFFVLILSIIYAFLAHSSLSSGIDNDSGISKSSFLEFASEANFAFWYFLIGLFLIIGGFIINVL